MTVKSLIYLLPFIFIASKIEGFSFNLSDPIIKTVVIDPGHGGHDPGCLGSGSQEKKIALKISLKLAELIKKNHPDVQVILTRNQDVFVPLHERAAIANRNNADLFISIHCNYFPSSKKTYGSETYVMGLHTAQHNLEVAKRENAAILLEDNYEKNYEYDPNSPEGHILLSVFQNAYLEQSITFANFIESHFSKKERRSRGVKQAGFMVLKETTMPSVLVETGYLSHSEEDQFLKSDQGQQVIAGSIASAFKDYYNLRAKEKNAIVIAPVASQYKVQLAAVGKPVDSGKAPWKDLPYKLVWQKENGMYKYWVEGFQSETEAQQAKEQLKKSGFKDAFVKVK